MPCYAFSVFCCLFFFGHKPQHLIEVPLSNLLQLCQEIFLCENDTILSTLALFDSNPARGLDLTASSLEILDELFKILDVEEGGLNGKLMGYVGKVVFLLLRARRDQILSYLNANRETLIQKFTRHINNFTVSEILKAFTQNHFISNTPMNAFDDEAGEFDHSAPGGGNDLVTLNWTQSSHLMECLVDRLVVPVQMRTAAAADGDVLRFCDTQASLLPSFLLSFFPSFLPSFLLSFFPSILP